jgi:hypothetical protein
MEADDLSAFGELSGDADDLSAFGEQPGGADDLSAFGEQPGGADDLSAFVGAPVVSIPVLVDDIDRAWRYPSFDDVAEKILGAISQNTGALKHLRRMTVRARAADEGAADYFRDVYGPMLQQPPPPDPHKPGVSLNLGPGKNSGGEVRYCALCQFVIVTDVRRHLASGQHRESEASRHGQGVQVYREKKGDAKNTRRILDRPAPGFKLRVPKDYRRVLDETTDGILSEPELLDRGEVGGGEVQANKRRAPEFTAREVEEREFFLRRKAADGQRAALERAALKERQRLQWKEEWKEEQRYWATYNMRAPWAALGTPCGDEGPG